MIRWFRFSMTLLVPGIIVACVSCSDSGRMSAIGMSNLPDSIRDPSAISAMTANIDHSLRGLPPIEDGNVPQQHFASIVRSLSTAKLDTSPKKWQVFGQLTIADKDGRKTIVYLFLAGPRPDSQLAFRVDDKYFLGGKASDLENAIRAARTDADRGGADLTDRPNG